MGSVSTDGRNGQILKYSGGSIDSERPSGCYRELFVALWTDINQKNSAKRDQHSVRLSVIWGRLCGGVVGVSEPVSLAYLFLAPLFTKQ